ncbi:MAG: Xaa-Pro peptidase family protein [Anaerolineae bacterium]|nr:Xaa-Pro peptidase family protein [Thermoflexales bacterium]MDW8407451.1 Xaa-Pro peptidase family protein [Anaerolineae bacterium]
MKSDLPELMRRRNLDALMISCPDGLAPVNTAFRYFIGSAHVTHGHILIIRRGHEADLDCVLAHTAMERDEAARSGLRLHNLSQYDMREIYRSVDGDRLEAQVELIRRLFGDLGVRGRVGFYGLDERGAAYLLLDALAKAGFVEVVVEYENDILSEARSTKDAAEVAHIRQACQLTEQVIGATREFLRSHRIRGETLIRPNGEPLTVGDVKAFIRREEASLGLEDAGCIFAIGRDAGVPHSVGTASDVIQLGRTIVFDIFPRLPSGYHADITRTWCLGYAPDEVWQAYSLVQEVHDHVEGMLDSRRPSWEYNELACDLFEARGHPTPRLTPGTTEGYVHSLGHGFGLAVHEAPSMRLKALTGHDAPLPAGSVITNEPGLYYPDKGWGVRLEDDYWLNSDGSVERLTTFDRALVIPLE